MIWGICRKIFLLCPMFSCILLIILSVPHKKSEFCGIYHTFLQLCHAKTHHFSLSPKNRVAQSEIFLYMPQNSQKNFNSGRKATHFKSKRGKFQQLFKICHKNHKIPTTLLKVLWGYPFNYINVNATYASKNKAHRNPITTSIGLNINFTADQ